MKNILLAVVAVVAVAGLVFGVLNFVQFQRSAQDLDGRGFPYMLGAGGRMGMRSGEMMGREAGERSFGKRSGPMGGFEDHGMGVLRDYQIEALAGKLGLTTDELTAKLDDGQTVLDLAADKGMTVQEFITLEQEAHAEAIDKALADGVLSQNQADWLKQNLPAK